MPGFDGTGPRGRGPMTGGGRGYCAVQLPGGRQRYWGRGAYGRRWGGLTSGAASAAPEDELQDLKTDAQAIREQLEHIEARIKELEG